MKTGWVWRSPGPLFAKDGTELHAGLGFLDKRLESLHFGLAGAPDEITARFAFHEKFLEAQLGQASSYKLGETLYRYRWGRICAAMDIKGSSSYIVIAWD